MGFFRPVMAVNKPASFPIESGIAFERGTFLWFKKGSGVATTDRDATYQPLGIADDDKTDNVTAKIQNQVISYTLVVNSSGNATATYSLGRTIAKDSVIETAIQKPASWTLVSTPNLDGTSTFTLSADGILTHNVTGATAGTYNVTLTLDYSYVKSASQNGGAAIVTDMFNNNSTAASQLVTVWFMEGIYESDQYDPYVSYSVGDPIYAKNGGILTSDSTNATKIGFITKVPSTNWNAETKTTLGHSQPKPEAVQFLMRLSLV